MILDSFQTGTSNIYWGLSLYKNPDFQYLWNSSKDAKRKEQPNYYSRLRYYSEKCEAPAFKKKLHSPSSDYDRRRQWTAGD